MGCSNSKSNEQKFRLTDIQRKAIQENAQALVLTNALLRVSATNVAARYRGNRTRDNILNDKTPLADYFGNTPIPAELGNGDKSVFDAFALVKRLAFENISGRLGPQIEAQQPKIKSDVELQKSARQAIQTESDAAVTHIAEELVDKCIFMATHPPEPQNVAVVAQTAIHDVPDNQQSVNMPHSRATAPVKHSDHLVPGTAHQPHHQSQRAASAAAHPDDYDDAVVLPKGDWTKAEGTPYYYSATENLYFHPPSGQFYDPSNEMWYDPDKDEWYSEEQEEQY